MPECGSPKLRLGNDQRKPLLIWGWPYRGLAEAHPGLWAPFVVVGEGAASKEVLPCCHALALTSMTYIRLTPDRYATHLGDGGGWLTGSSSFQPRRAVGTVFGAK
jgi:hypothetical protein